MEKKFEGKVYFERTSNTGDPSFDFDYKIGYNILPTAEELLSWYVGMLVRRLK